MDLSFPRGIALESRKTSNKYEISEELPPGFGSRLFKAVLAGSSHKPFFIKAVMSGGVDQNLPVTKETLVSALNGVYDSYVQKYFEVFEDERFAGFSFFVTEDLECGNMMDAIKAFGNTVDYSVPPDTVLRMFAQIAVGLYILKEHKIIHCDLTPTNIVYRDDDIRIGNYGTFGMIFSDEIDTPYLAPEAKQYKQYTFASDMYSLGAVIFHFATLTCYAPHGKVKWPPFFPKEFRSLIHRLLESEPFKRPTVEEVVQHCLVRPEIERLPSATLPPSLLSLYALTPALSEALHAPTPTALLVGTSPPPLSAIPALHVHVHTPRSTSPSVCVLPLQALSPSPGSASTPQHASITPPSSASSIPMGSVGSVGSVGCVGCASLSGMVSLPSVPSLGGLSLPKVSSSGNISFPRMLSLENLQMQRTVRMPLENDVVVNGVSSKKYQMSTVIGRFSLGLVYLCRLVGCKEEYAIKAKRHSKAGGEEDGEKKFALKFTNVRNSYLVSYIEVFEDAEFPGLTFFVMEYCRGGDMENAIKQAKAVKAKCTPVQRVLRTTAQMAVGLYVLRMNNILHRDIKPSNIFICEGNDIKLGDFGASRIFDTFVVSDDTFVGTPMYMAPERHQRRTILLPL